MPASQEQKVDFLLKKIGYSASKTGIAEDSTLTGSTKKAPFAEAVSSPLVIPQSSVWADSGLIPTTPPGSDTIYVKVYPTSSAYRMTHDATVGVARRTYIARSSYGNQTSTIDGDWIDTQFGADYIVKVYKGDPSGSGTLLQQAGANSETDGWFFDYSSGVLNFNGTNLPSGITETNIYIVGYRYIGTKGVQPPAGIGTFHDLYVSGVSTFVGDVNANSNVIIGGNLTVNGTQTVLNTSSLEVEDKNIGIASAASKLNDSQIDGAGITIYSSGGDKTITWDNSNSRISFNTNLYSTRYVGAATTNVIPFLYSNYSDLPSASTYHGAFAHVHATGRGYFAHAANWMELVNVETSGIVGTGTQPYNVGLITATGVDVTNNVDIDGDIDVDGRSELDIVNIAETLNVVGVSTFVGVVTTSNDLFVGQRLNVSGVSTFNDNVHIISSQTRIGSQASTNTTGWQVQLSGAANNDNILSLYNPTTNNGESIQQGFFFKNSNNNVTEFARIESTAIETTAATVDGDLRFYTTKGSAGHLTEKLRITGIGSVGIGTIDPTAKLHVNGDTKLQGNLHITGISTFAGNATFTGTVSAASTTGTSGQYLRSTGVGVSWATFPSTRSTSTQTATAGQTSFNFTYTVGYLDVFVNGVKLPPSEFTASNGSTVVLDDAAFENDTLEFVSYYNAPGSGTGAQNLTSLADVTITGTPVIGETLQHNGSAFVNDYTVSTTTTSTSQTAILSLAVATYRSAEYTIQITEGTKYHVTKVLAIHDGTNATFNEYGTLFTTSSLSTFALDVSSGNMRLLATPASTNSTVFKVKFTGIKV